MVAIILTLLILVPNLLLRPPVIDSVLFALAIAVGITPQLLPAVFSTSLATGSRRLAGLKVLVKRLVCIEDPGRVPSGAGCAGTDVRPGVRGPLLWGKMFAVVAVWTHGIVAAIVMYDATPAGETKPN